MITSTLLACFLMTPQPPNPNWELASIKNVICNNVVIVAIDQDPDLWVDLLGVGTPETIDPLKDRFLIGKHDLNWLQSWLPRGTPVWMERRGATASGRPLVFLYRIGDQFCWNSFLVSSGGAFAAKQIEFQEFSKFALMERTAREQRTGLWQGYQIPLPAHDPTAQSPIGYPEIGTHAAQDSPPSPKPIQTHHPVPTRSSAGSPVSTKTTSKKRPPYARQDWSRLDAMMNTVIYQALYGGGYGLGYGAFDPAKTQHVDGYYRSNGTYVNPYWRRQPGSW